MLVGIVIGRIWAVKKLEELPPGALLEIELETKSNGSSHIIAYDPLGCGDGERVLIATGSTANRATRAGNTFIDATVIASLEDDSGAKKKTK